MTGSPPTLLVFGLGYAAAAAGRLAAAAGWRVIGTTSRDGPRDGIERIGFDAAGACIDEATHLLVSVPPRDDAGGAADPVLARHGKALRSAPQLRWIGYFSTTGIYGDQDGGWVDEASPPDPGSARARRRIEAERAWTSVAEAATGGVIDLLRIAGIYGPGRSALDSLRNGSARRIAAPGHCFGRIHRDDIAGATLAAMLHPPVGRRVLNLADDLPEESAVVTAHAAELLGVPAPEATPLAEARETMSPMARSFWADNRKVRSAVTQQVLGYRWHYPTYREGLSAILCEERGAA
nr:SDR family NAD(P)-dependent oxidoreductase [uncultured Lichenicoccus sp.]